MGHFSSIWRFRRSDCGRWEFGVPTPLFKGAFHPKGMVWGQGAGALGAIRWAELDERLGDVGEPGVGDACGGAEHRHLVTEAQPLSLFVRVGGPEHGGFIGGVVAEGGFLFFFKHGNG